MAAAKKTPAKKTLVAVRVGSTLYDCDPRVEHQIKRVLELKGDYVTVQATGRGGVKSKVRRDRIHENASRKSGYCRMEY